MNPGDRIIVTTGRGMKIPGFEVVCGRETSVESPNPGSFHIRISKYKSTMSSTSKIIRNSMLKLRMDAVIVFCLLTLCYAYFYQDGSWNGNSRLCHNGRDGARWAVLDRSNTCRIQTPDWRPATFRFFKGFIIPIKRQGLHSSPRFSMLLYIGSPSGLGIQLDMTLVKHLLTFLALGLPSAWAGLLVYLFCEQVSGSMFRSFVVTSAVALGTLSFPFSVIYFGHQLAASFLFSAFFLIFRLKTRPDPAGKGYLFGVGLLLGLALITEYTTALIVIPLVLYYFWVLWQKRNLFSLAIHLAARAGRVDPAGCDRRSTTRFALAGRLRSVIENLVLENFQAGMSTGIMGVNRPSLRVLFFETFHPAMGIILAVSGTVDDGHRRVGSAALEDLPRGRHPGRVRGCGHAGDECRIFLCGGVGIRSGRAT